MSVIAAHDDSQPGMLLDNTLAVEMWLAAAEEQLAQRIPGLLESAEQANVEPLSGQVWPWTKLSASTASWVRYWAIGSPPARNPLSPPPTVFSTSTRRRTTPAQSSPRRTGGVGKRDVAGLAGGTAA